MRFWFKKKERPGPDETEPKTPLAEEPPEAEAPEDAEVLEEPEESGEAWEEPPLEISEAELEAEALAAGEPEAEPEPEAPPEPGEQNGKAGFFSRLRERLKKTREVLADRVDRIALGKKVIDADLLDELEEVLITSDLGVQATQALLSGVAGKVRRKELSDPSRLREELRDGVKKLLEVSAVPFDPRAEKPFVIMVVGVNGVGKTTTIGKLAGHLKREGLSVMLVAGDTFRAAAVEQLVLWGERAGVPVVHQKSGADPSAVAYDALDAAVSRGADVVILDTAGRMHTKVNLMEELKKVCRVVQKKMASAPHEVLLVLDATTGQNALSQARMFRDEAGVTGIVLTKLDGTAKGGVIVPICAELKLPVRFIGIGEGPDDLRPFDPEEFSRALF